MVGKAVVDEKRALWYLRKIPLFSELNAEALARLAEKVELCEVDLDPRHARHQ